MHLVVLTRLLRFWTGATLDNILLRRLSEADSRREKLTECDNMYTDRVMYFSVEGECGILAESQFLEELNILSVL